MAQGTVKFFHDEDGYGFFENDDRDDDVFFHIFDITEPNPEDGEAFEFDIEEGDRGSRAVNVHRA